MTQDEATGKTRTRVEGREFIVERAFDAPRALVWRAWTEPERLRQWWAPRGWSLPFCELDLRPGGVWRYGMRGPEGEESWGKAVYREIVPPERLTFVDSFTDAAGAPIDRMPTLDFSVEFTERDGGTIVISRVRFASESDLRAVLDMGMVEGMTESWDLLAEHLRAASA
jgi:uncharacterized protein YndB with AHSA1/START domain